MLTSKEIQEIRRFIPKYNRGAWTDLEVFPILKIFERFEGTRTKDMDATAVNSCVDYVLNRYKEKNKL